MKTAGIRNPYVAPEPPKPDPNDKMKNVPEPEEPPDESSIKLDGDSFGLSFKNVDEDSDLGDKLAGLLYDVNERFRGELLECGIKVLRPTVGYVAEPGEMVLRSKTAVIVVTTGAEQSEAIVFRRISHALQTLPIKSILDKHNARLHVRG
jgi:hypothetical protein